MQRVQSSAGPKHCWTAWARVSSELMIQATAVSSGRGDDVRGYKSCCGNLTAGMLYVCMYLRWIKVPDILPLFRHHIAPWWQITSVFWPENSGSCWLQRNNADTWFCLSAAWKIHATLLDQMGQNLKWKRQEKYPQNTDVTRSFIGSVLSKQLFHPANQLPAQPECL